MCFVAEKTVVGHRILGRRVDDQVNVRPLLETMKSLSSMSFKNFSFFNVPRLIVVQFLLPYFHHQQRFKVGRRLHHCLIGCFSDSALTDFDSNWEHFLHFSGRGGISVIFDRAHLPTGHPPSHAMSDRVPCLSDERFVECLIRSGPRAPYALQNR